MRNWGKTYGAWLEYNTNGGQIFLPKYLFKAWQEKWTRKADTTNVGEYMPNKQWKPSENKKCVPSAGLGI